MRNYLLNIMEEFPSNSELHVMAIMLLHFAIYMTENILRKKKNPKSVCVHSMEIYLNSLIYLSKIWETHNLKITLNPIFVSIQIYGCL